MHPARNSRDVDTAQHGAYNRTRRYHTPMLSSR